MRAEREEMKRVTLSLEEDFSKFNVVRDESRNNPFKNRPAQERDEAVCQNEYEKRMMSPIADTTSVEEMENESGKHSTEIDAQSEISKTSNTTGAFTLTTTTNTNKAPKKRAPERSL
mmetsp:Transcript_6311/g.5723  ORF Transcript_6311/g.5723 Transcript_6311/m.5723 type:complete len:117 (-) Transcript_6311:634-984(-)